MSAKKESVGVVSMGDLKRLGVVAGAVENGNPQLR